jgi:hypothetical protein
MPKRMELARAHHHGQLSSESLVGRPQASQWQQFYAPRFRRILSASPSPARLEASDEAYLKQASDDVLGRDDSRVAKEWADRTDAENCRLLRIATVQELYLTGLSSHELFRQ